MAELAAAQFIFKFLFVEAVQNTDLYFMYIENGSEICYSLLIKIFDLITGISQAISLKVYTWENKCVLFE